MTDYKLKMPRLFQEWEDGCKAGLCQGERADYLPWFSIQQFHSSALRSRIPSLKSGRVVHLMSQSEMILFSLLELDDRVYDIREQMAVNPELSAAVCAELHLRHPGYTFGGKVLTSDLLVTYLDGLKRTEKAFQVKYRPQELTARDWEKIRIEEECWKRRGIGFELWFQTDLPQVKARSVTLLAACRSRLKTDRTALLRLLKSFMRLRERAGNVLYTDLGAAGLMFDGGFTPHEAVKALCAHQVLLFPLDEKHLYDCALFDFEVNPCWQ